MGNPVLRWSNLGAFFTKDVWQLTSIPLLTGYYRPLFWVSFLVDRSLWGLDAFGYHLTNVILHAAATFVSFMLFNRILGAQRVATFASVLFALHPVHSEAVSFVSARVFLLTFPFVGISLWAYARASGPGETPSPGRLLFSLA